MDKSALPSEKKTLLFKQPWKHIGWACFYAWALGTVYTPNIVESTATFDQYIAKRLLFACAMAIAYASLFLLRRARGEFRLKPIIALVTGLGGALGTALFFMPFDGDASYAVWGVGCVLVGVCYVMNMTVMNSCLVEGGPQAAEVRLPVSLLMAFALYYALALMPSLAAHLLMCSLLPIGSIVYYFIAKRKNARRSTVSRPVEAGAKLEMRFLAYIAAYCFAFGAVLGCVAFPSFAKGAPFNMLVALGALTMIPVIALMGFLSRPVQWVQRIDLAARFFFIFGLAGLLAFGVLPLPLFNMNVFAAYVAIDLVMWYLNVALVSRSNHDPFYAVARAGMVQWGAISLGLLAALGHTGALGISGSIGFSALVFGALAVFLVVCLFVFPADCTLRLAAAKIEGASGESLEERCLFLSEQFGLSKRESEVFALLARGRSASFVSTELCISESTVKSHRSSIYGKLGVKSKQALLDMIEDEGAD